MINAATKYPLSRTQMTDFVLYMLNHDNNLGHDPFPLYESLERGFYRREVHIPAGHFIVGAVHTQESYAILLQGEITVIDEDGERVLKGPMTFTQPANRQKIGYCNEDAIWLDIHKVPEGVTMEQARELLFLDTYDQLDRLDHQAVIEELGMNQEMIDQDIQSHEVQAEELPGLQLRESRIHGQGMFATRPYIEEEMIGVAAVATKTLLGSYTNHSLDPNAYAVLVSDQVRFYARKDISEHDEITVNYRQVIETVTGGVQSCQQ